MLALATIFVLKWSQPGFAKIHVPIEKKEIYLFKEVGGSTPRKDVYALKLTDGTTQWASNFNGPVWVWPMRLYDSKLVFRSEKDVKQKIPNSLWCLDSNNGNLLYRTTIDEHQWGEHIQPPTIVKDKIHINYGYAGGMAQYDINSGQQTWIKRLKGHYTGYSPIVNNDYVIFYVGGSEAPPENPAFRVLNVLTGEAVDHIIDTGFIQTGGYMHSSLVKAGQRPIYVAQHNLRLIAFRWPSLGQGSILWTNTDGFKGQPQIGDNRIFVLNNGHIEKRRVQNGVLDKKWQPASSSVLSQFQLMRIKQNKFYIIVSDDVNTYVLTKNLVLKQTLPHGGLINVGHEHLAIIDGQGTVTMYEIN